MRLPNLPYTLLQLHVLHMCVFGVSYEIQGQGEREINVQGEPVFSVMAAGWLCEKSG